MEKNNETLHTDVVSVARTLNEQKMVALSNFLFEVGGWAIIGATIGGVIGTTAGPLGTIGGTLGGAVLGAGAALFHRAIKYRDP